jgi:hypothetical protein
MPSGEFTTLSDNLRRLRSTFLNFKHRPNADYTDMQRMKCRAYIAFSHAEFEHYLESVALRILDEAKVNWQSDKQSAIVATAILAFRRREKTGVPKDPFNPGQNTIETITMEAFAAQRSAISRNNGIKPENFAEMYLPLGVRQADINESLTIQLSNSGSHRGSLVHKSNSVSLTIVRDPFVEEDSDIKNLLDEIRLFDAKIQELQLYKIKEYER